MRRFASAIELQYVMNSVRCLNWNVLIGVGYVNCNSAHAFFVWDFHLRFVLIRLVGAERVQLLRERSPFPVTYWRMYWCELGVRYDFELQVLHVHFLYESVYVRLVRIPVYDSDTLDTTE